MLKPNGVRSEALAMTPGFALALALVLLATSVARAQPTIRIRTIAPQPAAPATDEAKKPSDESPSTAPTTRPANLPKGSFELVEWVVLLIDPNRPNAND